MKVNVYYEQNKLVLMLPTKTIMVEDNGFTTIEETLAEGETRVLTTDLHNSSAYDFAKMITNDLK